MLMSNDDSDAHAVTDTGVAGHAGSANRKNTSVRLAENTARSANHAQGDPQGRDPTGTASRGAPSPQNETELENYSFYF